jgi:ACS family tartrate transporter-like MFS transporter
VLDPSPSGPIVDSALQKASRRLLPFLFVLYVAAFLDRINVGFAQLQMKGELGFGDAVYGLGTGIFFIGYFVFEVPSNLILARMGARLWIARIMLTWGAISAAMALVRTPAGFYALRFLLGVAEAGFFPGIIYYLGLWFPPEQRASAVSRFMTAVPIAGLVGGPLSGLLLSLDGVAGMSGWQWIFVGEGLPSIALGIAVLAWLPDGPADARWLTRDEREHLCARHRATDDVVAARGHVDVRRALLHPTVWRLSLLALPLPLGLYTVTFWLPEFLKGLSGLGNVEVAILSAAPYAVAAVAMVLYGAHSDRTGERPLHVAAGTLVGALGVAMSAYAHSAVSGLVAFAVALAGILSAYPILWAVPTTFLRGTAAAGAIGLINSIANLGGFVGPYLVGRVHEATGSFTPSLLVISAFLLATAVLAARMARAPEVYA